jgi:drug/metabolite transporter (DMT)-like permease
MWYRWMFIAFLTNGFSQFGVRVIQDYGLAETHGYLYLSFWYLTGLAVAIATFLPTRARLTTQEIAIGAFMGLCSSIGWFLLTGAVGRGIPGYLVFPVAIGGSLSIVALVGVLVFRERLSVYGYLGVLCGIAGIVVLTTA